VAAKDNGTPLSKKADFPDIAELTYEQARDELISIVAQLEGGQTGLENSMTLWQRGEALAAHCSTWLDGAEAKLTAQD
jgi:exodeoxyribonuclease VII small subunit